MNLNFGSKQDYNLNSNLIKELIQMYGVKIKLVFQERVNNDQVIFGDYSHLFSDSERQFEIFQLPENPEELDNQDMNFSAFGLNDFHSVSMFIHRDSIQDLPGVEAIQDGSEEYTQKSKKTIQDQDFQLIGHLVVFPSGKIYEITDQKFSVPGVNNLYTTKNDKSAYKITLVPFQSKLTNELDQMDLSTIGQDFEDVQGFVPDSTLEDYFEEFKNMKHDQDLEAEILDQVQVIQEPKRNPELIDKSIVDNSETSPWD